MRRRDALIILGAAGAAVALPSVLRRLPNEFEFEPLPGVDGFRTIAGGASSGGPNPFAGLGEPSATPAKKPLSEPFSPCLALYGTRDWDPDRVPVAVFSDFYCPYCRSHDQLLVELEATGSPIRLVWHEMPLLGEGSERAARAMLAARFLDRADAARRYLWQTNLRPGPAALTRMAGELGLDPQSFRSEVDGPRVADALAQSLSLGARFGVFGTPATVVGRTRVIGAIRPPDLRKLIEVEQAEGPIACG
jgi:predicted DsbA family dithiol-disulfide isomerase